MAFGRVLRTGLSSLRDRADATSVKSAVIGPVMRRLAALRFNPSRMLPTWQHEWEPIEMHVESICNGEVVSRGVRRTKICVRCGHTQVFDYMPCRRQP